MVKCHLTLDDHRDHCLGSWWLRLRCEKIRDWFLQVARLFEVEAQLLHHTSLQISESKALITTVEALVQDGKLHPVQQAFVENDASQCGFCTPGFVVACKAFLDKHPRPSAEDVRRGLSGNLCRCGTYHGIQQVIAQMAEKGA